MNTSTPRPITPSEPPLPPPAQGATHPFADVEAPTLAAIAQLRSIIQHAEIPMLGTIMLQLTGTSHSFPIPDEWARELIADQYGADGEIAKTYPAWDKATLSVRCGILTFLEARIASLTTLGGDSLGKNASNEPPVISSEPTSRAASPQEGETPSVPAEDYEAVCKRLFEMGRELNAARAEIQRLARCISDDPLELVELHTQLKDMTDQFFAVSQELEDYKSTVRRVWESLGNPSYESLKGQTIWEVVASLSPVRPTGGKEGAK